MQLLPCIVASLYLLERLGENSRTVSLVVILTVLMVFEGMVTLETIPALMGYVD